MMHGGYYSRQDLNGFQEVFFLFELRRKLLVNREVRKFSLRRNFERLSHLKDVIGRTSGRMRPAFLEGRQLRSQRRVTFESATINPRDDRLHLLRSQAPVIAEGSKSRIGAPWRHYTFHNFIFDGPRPRTDLFERYQ